MCPETQEKHAAAATFQEKTGTVTVSGAHLLTGLTKNRQK